jgi:hypothetical protein
MSTSGTLISTYCEEKMNTQGARDPIVSSELNNKLAGEEAVGRQQLVVLVEAELQYIGGGDSGPQW